MQKRPLVILTGPTAVGKTRLSLELAKKIGGEIVSADSMQVYRYMDIGSAKIMPEEMEGVKHHLIDILDPKEEFNVVLFQQKCMQAMEEIYAAGHIPILTGGTGFYIQAVLYGIDFTENKEDTSYRKSLEERAKTPEGRETLHEELKAVDEVSAKEIHANNVKRVIRALEYYHLTGQKISEHNEKQREKDAAYNAAYFVLNDDRQRLYEGIEKRVDAMIKRGLVREVETLREMGCERGMVSMQGIGYKEILDYLSGETDLEHAVYLIKRETRHFAKRQLTWFRREKEVIWLEKPDFAYDEEKILTFMENKLKEKEII